MQAINDFIGSLNANTFSGLGRKLLQVWHNDIFVNGSKKNAAIELDKKKIIWPFIVLETDISRCDESFIEQFDLGVYDEVVRQYLTPPHSGQNHTRCTSDSPDPPNLQRMRGP